MALRKTAIIDGESALKPLPALEIRPPDVKQSTAKPVLTCELRHLSAVRDTHILASTAVPAVRELELCDDDPRPPDTTVKLTDPVDPTLLLPHIPVILGGSYDKL